jgi:hypothetical protein
MRTGRELIELAEICARQARNTVNKDVARELWQMATEYRKKAAELDISQLPDIGSPPSWLSD